MNLPFFGYAKLHITRTDELIEQVGRTIIPPDFVFFHEQVVRKKRIKSNRCSVLAEGYSGKKWGFWNTTDIQNWGFWNIYGN